MDNFSSSIILISSDSGADGLTPKEAHGLLKFHFIFLICMFNGLSGLAMAMGGFSWILLGADILTTAYFGHELRETYRRDNQYQGQ